MRQATSTVTRKGQVTVPVEIRPALGIKAGDKVSFILEDGAARPERRGNVADRTAGIVRSARPVLTVEQLREAADFAFAYEALVRDIRSMAGQLLDTDVLLRGSSPA